MLLGQVKRITEGAKCLQYKGHLLVGKTMARITLLSLQHSTPFATKRVLQRSLPLIMLALCLLLPEQSSAQQGQCFRDSNGRQVCCDANGNCR
jgi:hypothetical protein